MKKFLTSLMILGSVAGFSQSTAAEAKALLEASANKMKQLGTYRITFTYTLENKRVNPPVKQQETGSITIQGDSYRLKFLGTEQICNGKTLWNILTEDEEVQVTPFNKAEGAAAMSPSRILDMYKTGYSYKLNGQEKLANGEVIEYVVLKPRASETVDHIVIGIKKSDKTLYSYMERGTNGTETKFTVKELVPNLKTAAGFFAFNAKDYPGYYISQ